MKIGSDKDANKDHKKLSTTSPEPSRTEGTALKIDKLQKDCLPTQQELIDKQRLLAEKHHDEKLSIMLLIVGAGLIAYNFW